MKLNHYLILISILFLSACAGTKTTVTETKKKVETVKCKQAPKLAVIENDLNLGKAARSCGNTTRAADFDFAGLAG